MKYKTILLITLATLTVLTACQASSGSPTAIPSATLEPAAIYTSVAQTAAVRLTDIALQTPSATPEPPTATPDALQTSAAETAIVALLSATPTATNTSVVNPAFTSTPTFASTGLDKATFVIDVTIPDKTVIASKGEFTKTWKFQNTGTSTWTNAYRLVYISGEKMSTVDFVNLPISVPPGAQIDISVKMVAPEKDGTYKGFWQLRNPNGTLFGDMVYVEIVVGTVAPTGEAPTATPTGTAP